MPAPRVSVDSDPDVDGGDRVAVTVEADGDPFTAYRADDDLAKPVLYPLRTASGTPVTRGYPLDPRDGERTDHPHHVGSWLNYGDVDGCDFWGNSPEADPDRTDLGTVRHRAVERAEGGEGTGELAVTADWVTAEDDRLLREETTYRFDATADERAVTRETTLTAADGPVAFPDDKEGFFAVRVCRELEHPTEEAHTFTDSAGNEERVEAAAADVTGEYLSSRGVRGTDVWGTRAEWVALSGRVGDEAVTLAVFDHPDNPGAPTHWHARGYGLFAANPLGQAVFTDGEQRLDFALDGGESATFRYRLAVLPGDADPRDLDARRDRFLDRA